MQHNKIKGNGRIRCFLLGAIFSCAIFGLLRFEVNRLETQFIKSAVASSQKPQVIDCKFSIDPLTENALK